jgi:hypothetical protein
MLGGAFVIPSAPDRVTSDAGLHGILQLERRPDNSHASFENDDVFINPDDSNLLFICNQIHSVPEPHCEMYFSYDGMTFELSVNRDFLPRWPDAIKQAKALWDDMKSGTIRP